MDVHLSDQLLKGRPDPRMRVLDAGCGRGRNLTYLPRRGYDACGVGLSREAVARARALAPGPAPRLPAGDFRVGAGEGVSFADADFGVVISSAVPHSARDGGHRRGMAGEMWRVLRRGGAFFARPASGAGAEGRVERPGGRRYRPPGGSGRLRGGGRMVLAAAGSPGGGLVEPLKAVVVRGLRAMSTWCLRKS